MSNVKIGNDGSDSEKPGSEKPNSGIENVQKPTVMVAMAYTETKTLAEGVGVPASM